jgi:hypothetical protein
MALAHSGILAYTTALLRRAVVGPDPYPGELNRPSSTVATGDRHSGPRDRGAESARSEANRGLLDDGDRRGKAQLGAEISWRGYLSGPFSRSGRARRLEIHNDLGLLAEQYDIEIDGSSANFPTGVRPPPAGSRPRPSCDRGSPRRIRIRTRRGGLRRTLTVRRLHKRATYVATLSSAATAATRRCWFSTQGAPTSRALASTDAEGRGRIPKPSCSRLALPVA